MVVIYKTVESFDPPTQNTISVSWRLTAANSYKETKLSYAKHFYYQINVLLQEHT